MSSKTTQPGAGSFPGTGTGTGTVSATVTDFPLFDHEKLEVYRVAREFYVLATALAARKIPVTFALHVPVDPSPGPVVRPRPRPRQKGCR
jgi:hypothetical protein